jgi:hypothetical protein
MDGIVTGDPTMSLVTEPVNAFILGSALLLAICLFKRHYIHHQSLNVPFITSEIMCIVILGGMLGLISHYRTVSWILVGTFTFARILSIYSSTADSLSKPESDDKIKRE